MNMFEEVPAGGDVYVLKRILHDWDDATCVGLLRRCRDAMTPSGRVLVVDAIVAPRGVPDPVHISDLLMMTLLPGRERNEAEFRELLGAAGLRQSRVIRTPAMLGIVEGVRA